MSELDDILKYDIKHIETAEYNDIKKWSASNYAELNEKAKRRVKDLFIELVGDDSGVNPNSKEFYDGYNLAQKEMLDKIGKL